MSSTLTVTPFHVGDLVAEGELMPVFVHVIDHPEGRVLVDTGLTAVHPAAADLDPRVKPVDEWGFDPASIDLVVNTHLHFDHCGGNHLFPGIPIHVQRTELELARGNAAYTIPEWVDAPGVTYAPVDGDVELLPGIRLLAAPGHSAGSQIVVVDEEDGTTVIAGDTAVWAGELEEPTTVGQRLILSLRPARVWMSHARDPWTGAR